jgi:hypothetical protein
MALLKKVFRVSDIHKFPAPFGGTYTMEPLDFVHPGGGESIFNIGVLFDHEGPETGQAKDDFSLGFTAKKLDEDGPMWRLMAYAGDVHSPHVRHLDVKVTLDTAEGPLKRWVSAAWKKMASQKEQGKQARFEEGVSADPTANMSPEDAATWKAMNEEHGDKFKTARQLKHAGYSYGLEDAWFAFVGNGPFNSDTIRDISRITGIPFRDDAGVLHDEGDLGLKVLQNEYSGPLTFYQEKAGQVRENIVHIQFIEGMDKKKILSALQMVGKKYNLKVEPVTGYKKPQTRMNKSTID